MGEAAMSITVSIPHLDQVIGGVWNPSDAEKTAAFKLVVELSTRVVIIPLRTDEGLLSEALGSAASVFGATRSILQAGGPELARHRPGELSFAVLAGTMLNQVLRPITAYWHRAMSDYLERKPAGRSTVQYEQAWDRRAELERTFEQLRVTMTAFARVFAEASGAQEFLRTQLEREGTLYDEATRERRQGRGNVGS